MIKYLSRFLTFITGTFIAAYIGSLFSEDYKKHLSWWPYVLDIVFFLSLLLLLIKILQQNKQITDFKSQQRELEQKIKIINKEHQKNLQGQIQTKQRIIEQRDDYFQKNSILKVENKYQHLFIEQLLPAIPQQEIEQVFEFIDVTQLQIKNKENEDVSN